MNETIDMEKVREAVDPMEQFVFWLMPHVTPEMQKTAFLLIMEHCHAAYCRGVEDAAGIVSNAASRSRSPEVLILQEVLEGLVKKQRSIKIPDFA